MANYGFERNQLESMFNASLCRAGIVTGLADNAKVPNGALVFADNTSALPTTIYGTVDLNLQNFAQYSGSGDGAAYIVDSADVNETTDAAGNVYRNGDIITNLEFPKTKALRMRQLKVEDRFYIFDGNIAAGGTTPDVGVHLVPTTSSFLFTSQASSPASGLDIQIMGVLPLTAGLNNLGSKYLVKVVSL